MSTFAPTIALQWAPASAVSFTLAANPLITIAVSRLLLGEPLTFRKLAGLGLAIVGFAILVGFPARQDGNSVLFLVGMSLVMAGQICFALFFVIARHQLRSIGPTALMVYTSVLSVLMVLPFAPVLTDQTLGQLSLLAWSGVLFVAITHYFGQLGWLVALRRVQASSASLYFFLLPLITGLGAIILLGETVSMGLVFGGSTILAGVAAGNWQAKEARPTLLAG